MGQSDRSMQEKLDQFNNRKKSPTESLIEPIPEEEEIKMDKDDGKTNAIPETDDKFQHLTKKKKKVEDTHTRKTFLVRNDLVKRLNRVAKKSDHGFLTEFINTAIEYGLDQVENNED